MNELVEKMMNWFEKVDRQPSLIDRKTQITVINNLQVLSDTIKNENPIISGHLLKLSNFVFMQNGQINWGKFGRVYEILSILQSNSLKEKESRNNAIIFISHRSVDKDFADLLCEALFSLGIPRNRVFCSSLPGNDVQQQISVEVKAAIKNSCLNIALLSYTFYESAYCLNEAGIIWFTDDVPILLIGLPEISENNMWGFLNKDYRLRSLGQEDELLQIFEKCFKETNISKPTSDILVNRAHKLIKDYNDLLINRPERTEPTNNAVIETDDEVVLKFYVALHKTRKIKKENVLAWLQDLEIYDISVDNAFDLIYSSGKGKIVDSVLELTIETFRNYTADVEQIKEKSYPILCSHIAKSSDKFLKMWENDEFDDYEKLFIAYIVDEKMSKLGDRWMANSQISDIQNWEQKCEIKGVVSTNYGRLLEKFIQNKFVYAVEWTDHGNVRAYSLCASLKSLLFDNSTQFYPEFQRLAKEYQEDPMPF